MGSFLDQGLTEPIPFSFVLCLLSQKLETDRQDLQLIKDTCLLCLSVVPSSLREKLIAVFS